MWTQDQITSLLQRSDKAVERAMVALYDRQTRDEQATSATHHTNHRGFRSNHASKGSYYARWVQSGRRLTGGHLANARKIALQYRRQLTEQANMNSEPVVPTQSAFEPPMGSYAATARILAQSGLMTGDEADAWKDEMKDRSFDEPSGSLFMGE